MGIFYLDNSHNYDYNIAMNQKRKHIIFFNIVISSVSLVFGGTLYVLFRKTTIISEMVESWVDLSAVRSAMLFFSNKFTKYYLPDYFWGLSLTFGLYSIMPYWHFNILWPAVISFLCGLLWELLQFFDWVSGTGDFIDILLYLSAATTAVTINYLILRRKK